MRLGVTGATRTFGLIVVIEGIGRVASRGDDGRRVTADDDVTRGASERRPGRHIPSSAIPGIVLCEPFEAKLVGIRQWRTVKAEHALVFPRPARWWWESGRLWWLWDRGLEGRGRGYADDLAGEGGRGWFGG